MTKASGRTDDTAQRLIQDERRRLVQELHDALAPALWYHAQLAERLWRGAAGQPAEQELGELARGLARLYEAARAELEWLEPSVGPRPLSVFARELRPPLEALAGLLGFGFALERRGADPELPPLVQHHLSRVLREAVLTAV